MGETMTFPETVEEFMEQYKIVDREQVYTNGAELVPIFRMKQWFEHEKAQLSQEGTTSDTISRQAVKYLDLFTKTYCRDESATDDLVFRCSDCEFELRPSGKCLVKCMARKLCPDYKDFGSMGDL